MPPSLALLLALGFSAYVYWRESKGPSQASPAVWIATLWMMRCGSRSLDFWVSGGGVDEGNVYDQAFVLVVAMAGFITVARRSRSVAVVLRGSVPLVVLFAYMVVSAAWSPTPFDSCKRLYRAFGDLSMALIIATEANPMAAMLIMCRRCFILLIPISLALAKYFPALGRMQEKHWEPDSWVGVATHKNTLGQLCFLVGLILVIELFNAVHLKKVKWKSLPFKMPIDCVYLALTLYLLHGGSGNRRSGTSIAVFLLGIAMYLMMEAFKSRPRLVPGILTAALVAVGAVEVSSQLILGEGLQSIAARLEGKDPTLTGRTDLWAEVLRLANQSPIVGAGYGGFWTHETKEYFKSKPDFTWGPQQAHNGYIETYAQLGIIGVALLLWVIIHAVRGATRRLVGDFEYSRIRLILLLAAAVHNYAEAGFPRPTHLVWFTFLVVAVNPLSRSVAPGTARKPRRRVAREPDFQAIPGGVATEH